MKDYAVLAGLDWADGSHQICWKDVASGTVDGATVEHSAEAFEQWIDSLGLDPANQRVAICLEQSRGAVVYLLMGYEGVDLYPINPVTLADYRNAFCPSGAKDDPADAALLLEVLERHPESVGIWMPDDPPTRLLRQLCEDRRKLVDERTRLTHSLRSKLKEYFPQALQLLGESLFKPMACDFLMKWPTLQDAARARPATLRSFYYAHNSRNRALIEERIERIATSRPTCTDPVIVQAHSRWIQALISQIRPLNRAIQDYEKQIHSLFSSHPDSWIFQSLPGAGAQLAPRLLAAFGTDRTRYPTATAFSTYAGVAPVISRSGKSSKVLWRWHCPKFLRQSLVEFAGCSIASCPWAKTFYESQLRKGKGHHAALRSLAFKWVRIIHKCWQSHCPYDEPTYLRALQLHGSWIHSALQQAS